MAFEDSNMLKENTLQQQLRICTYTLQGNIHISPTNAVTNSIFDDFPNFPVVGYVFFSVPWRVYLRIFQHTPGTYPRPSTNSL